MANNNTKRKLKQLRKTDPNYFQRREPLDHKPKVAGSANQITRSVGRDRAPAWRG